MIKRALDIAVAALLLVVLAPVFGVVVLLVRAKLGTPVFFRQARPGLQGRPFEIIKFRTMTEARDSEGLLLPDGERLTRFGRFLRSSSLDELPELWNVLKGEMSLVGPRPLLMEYLPLYSPEQARRHEVRPGITGWAQVNGRNAISWEEKFAMDVWYVDNHSLVLDARVLVLTLHKVFKREGISAVGEATMFPFEGNNKRPQWKEAIIYESAKIIRRENLFIGKNSQIDDFTFINAGSRTEIGRFVHIAAFSSVVGGGELVIDDFAGLSAGCRIITGSDDFSGHALTNPTVPAAFTQVTRGRVHIGKHAILGTNVIVFPNVTIGEGAALGAGCIVRKDIPPWGIYVGAECRLVRSRRSDEIFRLETELLSSLSEGR